MKIGYESLIWLNDKDGKEYVCSLEHMAGRKSFEQLTKKEQETCFDVNQIVGTERW